MTKLQHTGKQFYLNIPKEHIRKLNWKKGDEIYITKDPIKDVLYFEKMPGRKKNGR
ncbi:hypothetical protein HYV81_00215 [Candidatus Woesearchaeota archaeon]|nr:hypothetical protein [Candidatus Woesearchaeota archaeon]